MDLLKKNSLFEGLPDADIERLESFIKIREFPKNSLLIDEGVPGANLYLLTKGHVKVTKNAVDGKEMILTTRSAGDFFGEMALLDDSPRSARVVAVEDCIAGIIGKDEFNEMMIQEPRVAVNILKVISRRLRQSNEQILQSMEDKEHYHIKQIERFQSLLEFSKAISIEREEKSLFNLLPIIAKNQILCDDVLVYIDDPSTDEIYTSVNQGSTSRELRFSSNDVGLRRLIALKKTLIIDDFGAFEHRDTLEPAHFWKNTASVLVAPIIEQNIHRGMIVLKTVKKYQWEAEDQAFLTTLASYASMVLRNMRLTRQNMMDEKMSAVGKASSSLLHDFKNLLSVIYSLAQLIKKSKGPEDTNDLIEKITKSANLMIGMSEEVLLFGQGALKLRSRPVVLKELIDLVLGLIENKAKHMTIRADIAPNLTLDLDPDKMARAFYNLLINACESVEKDGTIVIEARSTGKSLSISITDNGQGIPSDVILKIWAPFVTTKKQGTGLGLPIVKNVVEAHGGTIAVESKTGSGTKFIMTFPI